MIVIIDNTISLYVDFCCVAFNSKKLVNEANWEKVRLFLKEQRGKSMKGN